MCRNLYRPCTAPVPAPQAVFKEVVPITDPVVRAKIHQTYRWGCGWCLAARGLVGYGAARSVVYLSGVGIGWLPSCCFAPPAPPPCGYRPWYRMGYLKDVVLPRVLDDATFATLSSLMLFNNIEVGLCVWWWWWCDVVSVLKMCLRVC